MLGGFKSLGSRFSVKGHSGDMLENSGNQFGYMANPISRGRIVKVGLA